MRAGISRDLREMGSAWGKGVRESPAPQKAEKISSQPSARKEATWRSGVVRKDQCGKSEQFFCRKILKSVMVCNI
jgi:hypothetical protein